MPKSEVEKIYKEIQNILFKIIPEKWMRLHLYASILNGRGEMYFYYFPKRAILKPKPISCYEISSRFGINEEQYNNILSKLYNKIKTLNIISINKWTNLTISIVDNRFIAEYNYDDLVHSDYSDEQRHIFWEYKYLNIPIESMSKENQKIVEGYIQRQKNKTFIYKENLYIQSQEQKEEKVESKNIENNTIKNQILKC